MKKGDKRTQSTKLLSKPATPFSAVSQAESVSSLSNLDQVYIKPLTDKPTDSQPKPRHRSARTLHSPIRKLNLAMKATPPLLSYKIKMDPLLQKAMKNSEKLRDAKEIH